MSTKGLLVASSHSSLQMQQQVNKSQALHAVPKSSIASWFQRKTILRQKKISPTLIFPPLCKVLCWRWINRWVRETWPSCGCPCSVTGSWTRGSVRAPSSWNHSMILWFIHVHLMRYWLWEFTRHQDLFPVPLHNLQRRGSVWVYIMQMPVMETYPILSASDLHIHPVRRTREIQVPVSSYKFIVYGLLGKPQQNTHVRIRQQGWNLEVRHESWERWQCEVSLLGHRCRSCLTQLWFSFIPIRKKISLLFLGSGFVFMACEI